MPPSWCVIHPGRVVQISRLLHLVLSQVDGCRSVGEIAARVSAAFGRTVELQRRRSVRAGVGRAALSPCCATSPTASQPKPGYDQRQPSRLVPSTLIPGGAASLRPLFARCLPAWSPIRHRPNWSDAWLVHAGQLNSAFADVLIHPVLLLLILGLTLLSTLFHECGHAAACRYGGAKPGRIGIGIYLVWPVFYTDVTDSYRLTKTGRLRTDLGGVYFNALFALGLAASTWRRGTSRCSPRFCWSTWR